jgi:hypothetical protein
LMRSCGEGTTSEMLRTTETTAAALGLQLQIIRIRSHEELDGAFSTMIGNHAEAVLVFPSPLFLAGNIASPTSPCGTGCRRYSSPMNSCNLAAFCPTERTLAIWHVGARCSGQDSQRRQAWRFAGRATHKVCSIDQSQDRKNTGTCRTGQCSTARRQSDRMKMLFAAVRKSAFGPNAKCCNVRFHRESWRVSRHVADIR